MDKGAALLSELVSYSKYANYLPEEQRRESYEEIVERYIEMMREKIESLPSFNLRAEEKNISPFSMLEKARTAMLERRVLPSMRGLQFAGKAIKQHNAKLFNCAYLPLDSIDAFAESMYLLLCGCGVGFSVQERHVSNLPAIKGTNGRHIEYVVQDSIEGWADAAKYLLTAYMMGLPAPMFDYSEIRPEGALIASSGSRAPGPEPLMLALMAVEKILKSCVGRKLRDIDAHDIMCHLSDAVRAGGVRRSAMISIFDAFSEDMLFCKSGEWYIDNPQRGRANNTCLLDRNAVTPEQFYRLMTAVASSPYGEPGIYFTNDFDMGFNPCNEAALVAYSFCNLTTIDAGKIHTFKELMKAVEIAAFLGTLQASFTDFVYLRPQWKENTERDALIGVSFTNVAEGTLDKFLEDGSIRDAATLVKETNARIARALGIRTAARTTLMKPEGTSTCLLGANGSGVHDVHDLFYIRRMSLEKSSPLYPYLMDKAPGIIEESVYDKKKVNVLVPMRAPESAHVRDQDPSKLLDRILKFHTQWVDPGHNRGNNRHNVSATVSVPQHKWMEVSDWIWNNRHNVHGLSVLPYDGGSYQQTPFESCDEEMYNWLNDSIPDDMDFSKIVEGFNGTKLNETVACAGGACDLSSL